MPQIRSLELTDAKSRLKGRSAREVSRAPYRDAIAKLTGAIALELTPDPNESLRTLKLRVTLAAREVNRRVAYGVCAEGTLLVWLKRPKLRRGARPGKGASAA